MSARSRHREEEPDETGIDISPLIDIVFILVIFFIVTTVFNKEVGVDVNKPPRAVASKSLNRDSVMLAVTQEGELFYGGRNIGYDGVETVISTVQDGGDPIPVILICDEGAKAHHITKAIDAATVAGAKSVSIATQK